MYHLLFKKFYKCNGKVKHYMSSYFQLQIEKTDAEMPRLNLYKGDRTCCLLLQRNLLHSSVPDLGNAKPTFLSIRLHNLH